MTYEHAAYIYNQYMENRNKIKELEKIYCNSNQLLDYKDIFDSSGNAPISRDNINFFINICEEYMKLMQKKMYQEITE